MRLNQFLFLAALKRHGSFSQAAQALFISQPSLSAAIKELETELGLTLLKRSKQGTFFTADGEAVLEKAQAILKLMDDIRSLSQTSTNLRGTLSIASIPIMCGRCLFDALSAMKTHYPLIAVHLEESDSFDIIKAVAANRVDLGIIGLGSNELPYASELFQQDNLQFTPLYTDEICFWVGQHHPLRSQDHIAITDLRGYPCITYKRTLSKQDLCLFAQQGLPLDNIFSTQDLYSLKNYLLQSDTAFTFAPRRTTEQDIYSLQGFLHPLSIKDFFWPITLGWLDKPVTSDRPEKHLFLHELRQALQTFPPLTAKDLIPDKIQNHQNQRLPKF